jgi:hypothetical protein
VCVVDLTLDNVDQVKNIVLYGYNVYTTEADEGLYKESDYDLLGYDGKPITALSLGLVAKPRPELDFLKDLEGL